MLTKHEYIPLDPTWDKKVEDCCNKPNPDNPDGDCCYDKWTVELKEVNKSYKEAEEEARQKAAEFSYVSERRDQFKKWYDELTKANELQRAVCDQLEILCGQVDKIGINTQFTVDAIKILFCMIREYFLQLDKLREKYDELLNCIKCLNNPGLAPGTGLMKCIEDYGVKLGAAQASRDDLLKMVMTALSLAEKIDLNIGPDYGLLTVVNEWRITLNCSVSCNDKPAAGTQTARKPDTKEGLRSTAQECSDDACDLRPVLNMPICKDEYYEEIKTKYETDKSNADTIGKELMNLNKSKESLLACKQSLEAAIKEVDPKTRCK